MTRTRSFAACIDDPGAAHEVRLAALALAIVTALAAAPARAQGVLENPAAFGFESGIGTVSGWHCEAERIEIQFDDLAALEAAYGSPRADTEPVCGDTGNGFSLLWNYNILGPGQHRVRAYADGVQFGEAAFRVHTLGAEFVSDLELITDFTSLDIGKELELRWVESKQGFVISNVWEADFTLEDILDALGGAWSGTWHAPGRSGTVSMGFAEGADGTIAVENLLLTGTGCAAEGAFVTPLDNIEEPVVAATMSDGSVLELEFIGSESFTTLGGTFWFAEGPCAEADGLFYMFRH